MDSARSYHTSKTSVRRFEIMDYQAGLTDVSAQGQKTAAGGDTEQNTAQNTEPGQENTAENAYLMTAKEWQSRFQVSYARLDMRSSAGEQTISTIREYTVRYIFDLLFPSKNHTLRDWMQENGWSSGGTQTANTWSTGTGTQDSSKYVEANGQKAAKNNGNAGGLSESLQQNHSAGVIRSSAARLRVLNYVGESFRTEQEDTGFSTVGTVRTKDGREINFNINVNMSRRCEEYYREELNVAQFTLCDPLVINLDTDATELSDQTFYFDLDADGKEEEISMLKGGNGYLALDKNGDGIINDGSELFGTQNGDGFADLAQYDEDGNGWIDENDAIWSNLKIWCKDENGNDVLYKLSDKGVGAICLKNVSTEFTVNGKGSAAEAGTLPAQGDNSANRTRGVIRKTGIFLYENGNVGTVQHVDLAAYAAEA